MPRAQLLGADISVEQIDHELLRDVFVARPIRVHTIVSEIHQTVAFSQRRSELLCSRRKGQGEGKGRWLPAVLSADAIFDTFELHRNQHTRRHVRLPKRERHTLRAVAHCNKKASDGSDLNLLSRFFCCGWAGE